MPLNYTRFVRPGFASRLADRLGADLKPAIAWIGSGDLGLHVAFDTEAAALEGERRLAPHYDATTIECQRERWVLTLGNEHPARAAAQLLAAE